MEITEIHAHVATASADCDGPFYRDFIIVPNDDEIAASVKADGVNDFSEIDFRQRVLASQVSVYCTEDGTLQVSAGGFSWHETTDEGYRSSHVTWCDDDCDTGQQSQRDVYAEMMGY